LIKCN